MYSFYFWVTFFDFSQQQESFDEEDWQGNGLIMKPWKQLTCMIVLNRLTGVFIRKKLTSTVRIPWHLMHTGSLKHLTRTHRHLTILLKNKPFYLRGLWFALLWQSLKIYRWPYNKSISCQKTFESLKMPPLLYMDGQALTCIVLLKCCLLNLD